MSDNKTQPGAGDDQLVPEADEIMSSGGGEATADGPKVSDELNALRSEMEETKSNLLRALAETENVRRRAQRDVADARQYAVTSFARDLLSVSDNFKRALHTVDDMSADGLPESLKGLLEGVRMTERELTTVLERHGIKTLDPKGERFDPNKHQAMFEVDDPSVPSGTVVQVVQSGSVIGERILRPAMVGVSRGGPKPGEAQKPAGEPAAAQGSDEGTEPGGAAG